MNWTMILIGFSLAVLMGAGLRAFLVTLRPEWSARKRVVVASSVLPAITLVVSGLVLMILELNRPSDVGGGMHDLALRVVMMIGGLFTVTAFVGGLIGAILSQARRRR